MRILIFFILLIFIGCGKGKMDTPCPTLDCLELPYMTFSVFPMKKSALIRYQPHEALGPTSDDCFPVDIEFFISLDTIDFELVASANDKSGTFIVDGLVDGQEYLFTMIFTNCNLGTYRSVDRIVQIGEIPKPEFLQFGNLQFGNPYEIRVSPDRHQYIYNSVYQNWNLTDFANPNVKMELPLTGFYAQWHPVDETIITSIENIEFPITPNRNRISSKTLVSFDFETGQIDTLHKIGDHFDGDYDSFNPSQYWIRDLYYHNSGDKLYFLSNKDNKSVTAKEKLKFNNIWELDVASKSIKQITNLLPRNIEIRDFVNSPIGNGRFYFIGTKIKIINLGNGNTLNRPASSLYLFREQMGTASEIYEFVEYGINIDISPDGSHLVFSSNRSGQYEIYKYRLSDSKLKRLSASIAYTLLPHYPKINWISADEFIVPVESEGERKLAKFKL